LRAARWISGKQGVFEFPRDSQRIELRKVSGGSSLLPTSFSEVACEKQSKEKDHVYWDRHCSCHAIRSDGSLDEATVRQLVRRQIDAGIDFLVPCGTTGESPTLTHEEHLRVVKSPSNSLRERSRPRWGRRLQHCGGDSAGARIGRSRADGILSVTPYYNKPTQEGLFSIIAPSRGSFAVDYSV